jgi:hypothetical protein
VVVVPNKIITAICFPSTPVFYKCPNIPLLLNEWQPKDSNALLENTCLGEKKPFSLIYEALKNGKSVEEERMVVEGKVKLSRDEQ